MTEHFTREEAVAVADASGMLDCKLADFETTLQAFANAAVTAKLKEWEAQGAVARVDGYYGGRCVITPLNTAVILPTGMALYTHTLPAAPQQKEV